MIKKKRLKSGEKTLGRRGTRLEEINNETKSGDRANSIY